VPFSGICDLGRYLGGVDAIDESVAADLEASSLRSIARPDIMSRKYAKLVFNLVNVVEAASGRGAGDALLQRARAEALACLERSGIVPFTGTDSRVEEMRVAAVEGVERGAGSTWQSLARGAQTLEVDDLNGEISLLGRLHGIPTPANAYLQRLARRLVRERIAPGGLDARELEEDGLASTTT
jgi:2-dehydropantoate 2-reductase